MVLDAEKLEYISSAGLRVILRLRKQEPELAIVNASPEVYEIFEMTGFTEMMPVSRAYRRRTAQAKKRRERSSDRGPTARCTAWIRRPSSRCT